MFDFDNFNNDAYNSHKTRNRTNTLHELYNCAGYALETYNWYRCGIDNVENRMIMRYAHQRNYKAAIYYALKSLLFEFPQYTRVSLEDVYYKRYSPKYYHIIAFRFSPTDYHFKKLGKNGCWYDKRGKTNEYNRTSYYEIFSDKWYHNYDSDIIFLVCPI